MTGHVPNSSTAGEQAASATFIALVYAVLWGIGLVVILPYAALIAAATSAVALAFYMLVMGVAGALAARGERVADELRGGDCADRRSPVVVTLV
jgi:hypothetical protein